MRTAEANLRLGTLGSAATFAGEAAAVFLAGHPQYTGPAYYPSMDACWEALKSSAVDAILMGVERTGQPHHGNPVMDHELFVTDSLVTPLSCCLYRKIGTTSDQISRIIGHGSIKQCSAYLAEHYPGVPLEMHAMNSVAAAKEVASGDGSLLVVGTHSLPMEVPGLQKVAVNIDQGAQCRWWILTRNSIFADEPATVIVCGQFASDGRLGQFITALIECGLSLSSIAAYAVNKSLSHYNYLLSFNGPASRTTIEKHCALFGCRLAGAFI